MWRPKFEFPEPVWCHALQRATAILVLPWWNGRSKQGLPESPWASWPREHSHEHEWQAVQVGTAHRIAVCSLSANPLFILWHKVSRTPGLGSWGWPWLAWFSCFRFLSANITGCAVLSGLCSAGDKSQDFMHTRQAFDPWAVPTSPQIKFLSSYFVMLT